MRSFKRRSSTSSRLARARLPLTLTALTLTVAAAAMLIPSHDSNAARAQTKVILNGKTVPVHFNDGDTFRVLAGEFKDSSARLAGFNTLESYGPVHVWGNWTAKELYVLAKMGTHNGRDGVWECETDGSTDSYGRLLAWCPKLAEDQIRKGYAHVMTVDDQPGRPELIAAQKEAIAARRGIWAHGVPDFLLTSLHSKEEDVDGRGTYNRLVSTVDGHSVKWRHNSRYGECDRVCSYVYTVDAAAIDALIEPCKSDPQIGPLVEHLSDAELRTVLHDFAKHRIINRKLPEAKREQLNGLLLAWADSGRFGEQQRREAACMIHVPFERRFGGGRAECLK